MGRSLPLSQLPVPTLPFTAHPEAVSSGEILGCSERLNGARPAKLRHCKCEFHTRPRPREGWSRSCSRKFPVAGWLSSNCLPAWRHLKSSRPPERASDWSVAHLLSAGVQVLGLARLQNQVGGSRRGNSKGRDAGQQNQTEPPTAAVHICKNSHNKNSSYLWIISIARNCVKCFISFMSHSCVKLTGEEAEAEERLRDLTQLISGVSRIQTWMSIPAQRLPLKKKVIWLCWVLVAARGIFHLLCGKQNL